MREQVATLTSQLNNGQNESVKNVSAKNKLEITTLDLKNSLQTFKEDN
jgi:chromosome segregation ATPase